MNFNKLRAYMRVLINIKIKTRTSLQPLVADNDILLLLDYDNIQLSTIVRYSRLMSRAKVISYIDQICCVKYINRLEITT